MLPAATLPAARYYVTPARRRRACGRGLPGPRREARRREEPARDAAAGLAEVMAMPAIWKDAAGNLLELPGPGGGIVVCGALPGAAAPVPAWTAGELAAAGVAAEPGPVRDGTGLGLVSCVTGPALIDEALAGTPARRARKITPRLAMELSLARALEPGTAPAVLRALAQRPREADPGYDLPAASSLSDADAFLQVKPFLRLLALLCGRGPAGAAARRDARAASARHGGRGPGRDPAAAAGTAGRAVAGRPLARAAGAGQGRHRPRRRRPERHRPQKRARAVPQRRALRPAGQHRRPRRPAGPHGGGHRRVGPRLRGVGGRAVPHRGDHPRRLPRARLRAR